MFMSSKTFFRGDTAWGVDNNPSMYPSILPKIPFKHKEKNGNLREFSHFLRPSTTRPLTQVTGGRGKHNSQGVGQLLDKVKKIGAYPNSFLQDFLQCFLEIRTHEIDAAGHAFVAVGTILPFIEDVAAEAITVINAAGPG